MLHGVLILQTGLSLLFQDNIASFSLIFFVKCYSFFSDFPRYSYHFSGQMWGMGKPWPYLLYFKLLVLHEELHFKITAQNKSRGKLGNFHTQLDVSLSIEIVTTLKWNNSNSKVLLIFNDFSKYLSFPDFPWWKIKVPDLVATMYKLCPNGIVAQVVCKLPHITVA